MAKKERDNKGYQIFKEDMKASTPGTCYIFHGEEQYMLRHWLGKLRELLVPQGMEEFNLHQFSGKDLDLDRVWDAVDALPVMSSRSMVQVSDFDLFKAREEQQEQIRALLSDLPEYVCLVFVYEQLEYKTGPKSKYTDFIRDHAVTVEFAPRSSGDITDWICRKFRSLDRDIEPRDAEYLVFLCGGLMTGLENEIKKIASYAKTRQITKGDIDAVADPVLDARVFQITNHISDGQVSKAMEVLSDLYAMGQSPIMILAVLGKYLRQLYTARLVLESGQGMDTLKEMWGMASQWQAEKLMKSARRYDLVWCRKAMTLAAECDLRMKSTGLDPEHQLTELLLRLADS